MESTVSNSSSGSGGGGGGGGDDGDEGLGGGSRHSGGLPGVAGLSLLARAMGACARCGHLIRRADLQRISSDLIRGLPEVAGLAGPAAATKTLWALGR